MCQNLTAIVPPGRGYARGGTYTWTSTLKVVVPFLPGILQKSQMMSYPTYPFISGSGHQFPAPNNPHVDFDFDGQASSERAFWEPPKATCHLPEECLECHAYFDHLCAAETSPTSQRSSFVDGVHLGRNIQRNEDIDLLSRYRSRLQWVHGRHRESVLQAAKYRTQLELLERELVAVKDRLMAVQIAYEDLSMARLDDMPATAWNTRSSDPWDSGSSRVESPLPSSPALSSTASEGTDVPMVVREGMESDQFPNYYLPDEDDFEVAQQMHMMDDREMAAGTFWDDFRARNFSDVSSVSLGSGSDSSLSCVSTAASSSEEKVLSPSPELPKNVVGSSGDATTALDIAQLSALMASAHESGNTAGLNRVRTLIQEAERIPKRQRTAAQIYLLTNWRSPSRSPNTSPPIFPSIFRPNIAASSSSVPEIFVDASGGGIGLVFNGHWLAWSFTQNHPHIPVGPDGKTIMSWAELIAVELGILTLLANGHRNTPILVRSDNEGVVTALTKKSWTQSHGLGLILTRILRLCEEAPLELRVKWVWTKMNPADGPSRGAYPPKDMMMTHAPNIPQHLVGILHQVEAV